MNVTSRSTGGLAGAIPRASSRAVDEIVVASVPSGHVYVRHLAPDRGPTPQRLADPDPERPDRPAGARWWPPAMLDPRWAAMADFDLFHLHFGFDACEVGQLTELVDVLRSREKPFVFTLHDLRNPHHVRPEQHVKHLDVLVPAADALVTLTPGAAVQISRRWGSEAHVVPHPHVVDFHTMRVAQECRARRRSSPNFRVGLHVKSLRPSMDPHRILPTLVDAVAGLPGAVLQVNAHRDVLDDDGARRDSSLATYLRDCADRGQLELHVHDYLSDRDLWRYLGSLDASVLPYRFGTHSGWLEACRDLGATVIAPSCGFYAEQGPVLSYVLDESRFEPESLAAAVREAYETRPQLGASIDARRQQRRQIAAAHETVYRSVLG